MAILVIAYPKFSHQDLERIQLFRRDNDSLYFNVVDPHFTLVFQIENISETIIIEEVKRLTGSTAKINFETGAAMIKKDELSEYYHCFLIPGKGNDNISKLHDLLYSEKLKQYLRTDIEYLPHINIGNSKDKNSCEKMVSKWNAFDYCITGSISKLSVVSYNNSVVTLIKELELSVE